ncbi:MAG: LexA family protein [Kofleriaceae bacterium]
MGLSMSSASGTARFTEKQGQYLAFIYTYVLLHRQPPAEADFQRFFRVTPPSVHQMIVQLEKLGLIRRTPRQARSIELLVPEEELPRLQPIKTSVAGY